jgi:hypothetical protein
MGLCLDTEKSGKQNDEGEIIGKSKLVMREENFQTANVEQIIVDGGQEDAKVHLQDFEFIRVDGGRFIMGH